MTKLTDEHDEQWQLLVLSLKLIAEEKGISQEELAVKTGLQQSNISRVFGLKYAPSMRVLLKIASALDLYLALADKTGLLDGDQVLNKAVIKLREIRKN